MALQQAGRSLLGGIGLPSTVDEDLRLKPRAQEAFLTILDLSGRLRNAAQQRHYLNFYGNLMRASDLYLVNVLAALKSVPTTSGATLLDDSLVIRTSDHGEMGLAYGGRRQKNSNLYEESIRVPLVYSNPRFFRRPRRSGALVSHVDFLPTLAGLVAQPRPPSQGRDYSRLVLRSDAPGAGLHRLHLRRLPGRAGEGALRAAAAAHREHPREALEDREVLRPRRDGARRVGDVRPADGPARDDQPRPPGYRRTRAESVRFARLRKHLASVQASRLPALPGAS